MRIKVTAYYTDDKGRDYMTGFVVEKEISGTPYSIGTAILKTRDKFRAWGHKFECSYKVDLTEDVET